MKNIFIIALTGLMFSTMSAMDLPDKVVLIQNESSVYEYKSAFTVDAIEFTITNEVTDCLEFQAVEVLQKSNFHITKKIFLVDHGLSFRIVDYENLLHEYNTISQSLNKRKCSDSNDRVLDKIPIRFS